MVFFMNCFPNFFCECFGTFLFDDTLYMPRMTAGVQTPEMNWLTPAQFARHEFA